MSSSNLAPVLKYQQPDNIIITRELEKWHLDGLFDRTIDAVRVVGYFSQQAARLTWSCFIGLEDNHKALQVWS
ncbi:hypothetical protein [Vibrio mimicus]|uniref:hypothetical protein n=1 Tax=Vibrio mimicus TaxID=674 RepID=UPI0002D8BEB3|nr:hypothetical protein [Vibrio mimicus]